MVFLRKWRGWLLVFGFAWGVLNAAELSVRPPDARGWVHFQSPGTPNSVHVLEASADLAAWRPAAVLHDGPFDFADVTAPTNATRFLRLASRTRTANDDGKNQLRLPEDPFLADPVSQGGAFEVGIRWVKFAIVLGDQTRVWFQDSGKFAFHHDYARLRLPPFIGLSREEFDRQTLFREGQVAVLGAVLLPDDGGFPGSSTGREFGIQFVGQDAYTREEIAAWFELVRAGVLAPEGARAFYLPTFEQTEVANQHRDWFAERGIEVSSAARWLTLDAVYSAGWALGRLRFIPAGEINAAYADGRLGPTDILLTDAVPAEVPFVAGIITLTPATPNSHVAILARGFGVPFVWFSDPDLQAALPQLDGREVALRTGFPWSGVTLLDVTGRLDDGIRGQLLALKNPPPLNYQPKQQLGVIATNVTPLTPAMLPFVGGKAANYGLLLRRIPQNTRPAIALTFDLWDDFLAQDLPTGKPLAQEINDRLGGFAHPPDMPRLRAELNVVRDLIRSVAKFTPARQAELLGVLTNGGFTLGEKIRFRSSTNVEDSEEFTGAGLYDSYSGCLLDDLDGDASGPSHCDPAENNERGVFRAIQRVYASFYNENAFLERLRRQVDETEVGMAVLVHHSYPDADELANGVATLTWRSSFGSIYVDGTLVTQLGAESVTNPDSTARPEVVEFFRSGNFTSLTRRETSSRVPLGGYVMNWEADYQALVTLLATVANGYREFVPQKPEFQLDFEYKRVRPGVLEIKQVRPLPAAPPAQPVTAFLLPQTMDLCVEEGEFGFIFAKHRLKAELSLATDSRRLDATGLASAFYQDATLRFLNDTNELVAGGGLSGWPEFRHSVAGEEVTDRWSWGTGAERLGFALTSAVITRVTPPDAPWVVQADFRRTLEVTFATPQRELTWEGAVWTTNDFVILRPCPTARDRALPQERRWANPVSGVTVVTRFFWPRPPAGPSAGYTAPNTGFVETIITGLTTEPLVLRSARAQTYSPGHHNFSEQFLWEPRRDPGVTAAQLAELAARDIRYVLGDIGFIEPELSVISAEGAVTELP